MILWSVALIRLFRNVQTFLAKVRPDIKNGTFSVQTLDGGSDSGQGTTEAVRASTVSFATVIDCVITAESGHPVHRRCGDERPDHVHLCWKQQPGR